MRDLEWNRALLTSALISGADISMPAFEPQEDILNIYTSLFTITVAKIRKVNKLQQCEAKQLN